MANANLPPLPPNSALKVRCSYECRDGTRIDDLDEAELHNVGLELLAVFLGEGYTNDGALKRFCLEIAKNSANPSKKYAGAFESLRKANQRIKDRKARAAKRKS